MPVNNSENQIWRSTSREHGFTWSGRLEVYWEVHLDPISDDYTPNEISAEDLFSIWSERVQSEFSDGLIPIYWFVMCEEAAKFESMPFQFNHFDSNNKDFLTYFTWPENPANGEKLNWLTLPVVDKLWNSRRADKGGFIQEYTKWKPSILQPYVFLPALSSQNRVL